MGKKLLLAFALTIPMMVFYIGYLFNHNPELIPTGFIQYDNVSYVAYGKQYVDADTFHFQYSNPFNDSDNYKPIYFQTQFLFFGLLIKSGIPPGWIMIPFSLICAFICFFILIGIYDHLINDKKNRVLTIWLWAWGGGFLTIAGIIAHVIMQGNGSLADDLFLIDPEKGWWGLNLGRSLFFSCEAYYHALFLGSIYMLLKKRWLISIVLLFLLCASHPFTGLELAAIISAWCAFEFFYNRKNIPLWYIIGSVLVLLLHVLYYLVYLEQFADHKSVSQQYTLNWRLRYYRLIPAYIMVGSFAVLSIYRASVFKFIAIRSNRIFLSWFVVAFLLINHELFMTARQPVHFSRGYVWTSLILLGLPAFREWIEYLKNRFGKITLAIFCFIFFFDNLTWITSNVVSKAKNPDATYISGEQASIFDFIDKRASNKTLIISNDNTMAYLSAAYTSAYPWYSHPYTTPFAQKKRNIQDQFFMKGSMDSSWINRNIIFIMAKKDTGAVNNIQSVNAVKILQTPNYVVFETDSLQN